jgi:hypothetical protein
MVRFAFAGLVMLALAGTAAGAEDHGPALVELFAKTCALRPALPGDLERIASALGFVSDGGPIKPELERGPRIDVVYMARLKKRGEDIALSAYFEGPADGPTVSCALNSVGVSADALPELIEKALSARDRAEKASSDNRRLQASWRVKASGDDDTLEMSAWREAPQRASIHIAYRGHRR